MKHDVTVIDASGQVVGTYRYQDGPYSEEALEEAREANRAKYRPAHERLVYKQVELGTAKNPARDEPRAGDVGSV